MFVVNFVFFIINNGYVFIILIIKGFFFVFDIFIVKLLINLFNIVVL